MICDSNTFQCAWPACTQNSDCTSLPNEYCNTSTNTCEQGYCTTNEDCLETFDGLYYGPNSATCANYNCEFACSDDAMCAPGSECIQSVCEASGLSGGAIFGIVVGCGVVFAALVALCCYCKGRGKSDV